MHHKVKQAAALRVKFRERKEECVLWEYILQTVVVKYNICSKSLVDFNQIAIFNPFTVNNCICSHHFVQSDEKWEI